jgi:DNA-binding transcriptional MerR regulator
MSERRRKSPPAAAEAGAGAREAGEDTTLSIGDLAEEFGITTRAIRFYEARGLLAPSRVGANRSYARRDRARLALILRGKNLGFTLEDIAEYLALYDADPAQVTQTRLLLAKVEAHIAALSSKRRDITRTLKELKAIRAACRNHLARRP